MLFKKKKPTDEQKAGTTEYFPTQIPAHKNDGTILPVLREYGAPYAPKPPAFLKVPDFLSVCQPLASTEEVETLRTIREPFRIPDYPRPEVADVVRGFRLLKGCKTYIEIGTFDRGNLAYVSSFLADDALLIGVEGQVEDSRDALLRSVLKPNQRYVSVIGDSLAPGTVEQVKTALDGRPADAIFIDACHIAYHVMSDYVNYGALVSDGDLILFHDSLWEGDPTYKGVCDALAEIDRLEPVYLVPHNGPVHRFMRPLFRDPHWGVVGVLRKTNWS